MPAVPVYPTFTHLDAWTLWKTGRICAANVTWSADASDPDAQQNYLLSPLAIVKGYNAIRLVLSAGSSESAWDDMYLIATEGWASSTTLTNGGQAISEIRDNITNILIKCAKLGLGVIFDCHDFFQRNTSSGAIGPLWVGSSTSSGASAGKTASQLRDALVSFWTQTVAAFPASTYPAITGYEILNEPNPDPSLSFAQMQSGTDNCWSNLATRCIKAIRAAGGTAPIIVDGIYYADPYGLKYFDPNLAGSEGGSGLLDDYQSDGTTATSVANRRLVYSFHVYGPYDFTHQGVSEDLYGSIGLPYPLDAVAPYTGGTEAVNARMRITVYDGSATAMAANSNTAEQQLDLPFRSATRYADFVARNQPALDFKTHATSAQGGVAVPVFVGEFSAIDTTLMRSDHVATTAGCRAITKIEVDSEGLATITLQSALKVRLYPQYTVSSAPGYGGAYNDYARATVTVLDSANEAYNISYALMVRIENGSNQIVPPFRLGGPNEGSTFQARRLLALLYSSSLANTSLGDGSTPIATLTLKPGSKAADQAPTCRTEFTRDTLQMCIDQGLSWAYWQEDGYTATASTIDSLNSGVFVGWRPNTGMTRVLTLAATRRTVSTS